MDRWIATPPHVALWDVINRMPAVGDPGRYAAVSAIEEALRQMIADEVRQAVEIEVQNVDYVLDAVELSGRRREAEIAGYVRRVVVVERHCRYLTESLAARDVALSAAAEEVAKLRAENDRLQRLLKSATGDREVTVEAWNGAVDARTDAERTLEAVREELRWYASEAKSMRLERDAAVADCAKTMRSVDSLRHKARAYALALRDQDPQRNVTQGLLRVEQQARRAAADALYQRIGRSESERDQLRAEVERLRGVVTEGHSHACYVLGIGQAHDCVQCVEQTRIAATCRTCDGTLAPDGSCPTCEAAAGIAAEWSTSDALMAIAAVSDSIDATEAERQRFLDQECPEPDMPGPFEIADMIIAGQTTSHGTTLIVGSSNPAGAAGTCTPVRRENELPRTSFANLEAPDNLAEIVADVADEARAAAEERTKAYQPPLESSGWTFGGEDE